MNRYIFYVPMFVSYFFIKQQKLLFKPINSSYITLVSLMFLATFPLYTLYSGRMTLSNPGWSFIPLLFAFFPAGFALQSESQDRQFVAICCFVLGLGFNGLIISGYSFLLDPLKYGYGLLIDPFSRKEINSPAVSNNLSILEAVLTYFIIEKNTFSKKIVIFTLILITLIMAIFLGGRSFFVIFAITILFFLGLKRRSWGAAKNLIFILAFLVGLISLSDYLIADKLDFILRRSGEFFESKRFALLREGINLFMDYPLGGFEVDKNIDNTKWFHNIFLDSARVGGWIPTFMLFLAMLYVGITLFKKRNRYFSFLYFLFLIAFLLTQQDVVLEENFQLLILIFFCGVLLHNQEHNIPTVRNQSNG